mgnify:CR=1 FL=1
MRWTMRTVPERSTDGYGNNSCGKHADGHRTAAPRGPFAERRDDYFTTAIRRLTSRPGPFTVTTYTPDATSALLASIHGHSHVPN